MARHIAWDVGAAGLSVMLADRLGCPAILSGFSRLVIDPNRGEDDPTLIMQLYDGSVVPGNRRLTEADIAARTARLHHPYHTALAALCGPQTVIVAVHSYTPALRGRPPRPWQVGILYSHLDDRLSRPLLARLQAEPDLCVGDNQPYAGHLPGDSIDRHALAHGRLNTLVEVRNDLIATPMDQEGWANRLAVHLRAARGQVVI
jgi:predicted N-formylglutamate amidohydrolase